jgi:hypothetical protein
MFRKFRKLLVGAAVVLTIGLLIGLMVSREETKVEVTKMSYVTIDREGKTTSGFGPKFRLERIEIDGNYQWVKIPSFSSLEEGDEIMIRLKNGKLVSVLYHPLGSP